jgi:signal transduction histidine kinase/CheY-like chemotaxis protein/AraC-like DNA-binding protein/streptogramin lyase
MLYVYDKVSGNFIKNDVFSHSSHITSRMISRLYSAKTEMGEQLLLIGTQTHGMKIFDVNRQTTKDCFRYDEDGLEISVRDFLQKGQDEVWAATTSGLIVYNLRTQEYTYIRHRVSDPFALSSDLLVNLYNDREGGIWLGTYAGGVNYYSPYRIFTKYYSYPDIEGRTMRGNIVHDICTDKFNQVWIATEDAGINRYNPATSKFTNYAPNVVPGISHVNIHGLVADDDYLWVGNISGVIDRLRLPGGQPVKSYTLLSNLFQQPVNIVNMKKLDDILLVATTRGLFQYSPINDSFEHLSQFPNTRIQSIYRDYEGIIWAGTGSNGLYFYNPSTGSYGKFERDVIFPNENHSINDILEDSERQLWFATNDGIRVYNPLLRTVKHYTTIQGLPGNMAFRILPDEFGNMWITTTSGLACLNPYTDYITVYTQGHGLIMNQFNYNSGCKDAQGRIYFGTLRGMISFDPKEITTVYDKVQVALTHVTSYDGTELMLSSKGDSNSIVLTHDQSTFALGFSALSYLSPSIIQYAYRMEGLTDNWTYLKGSFTASYTNLAPGKYQFRVRAANISGIWNDETTLLSIIVLQPWWLTTVARVCYVLIVVLLLAVCVYVYGRQSKHKADHNRKIFENEKEKELYQAKIKFFTNVSHEIRTPLTLIKSPLDKVMKYDLPAGVLDYLAIINKNVNWLLDLVNQLLDFRKTELDNYKLNFVKTDLSILIQEVCDRFSNAIEDKGLWLDIQIHTLNHNAFVDPESCTKIISNLLSNAVKHARTSIQVSLSFQENDKMFIIEVKDDGEPIPPQIKHKIFEPFFRYEQENLPGTGLGLPLAKSLAEMHGGTLEVVEIELFMLFHLRLPVNQSLSIQLPEKELIEQTESVVINRSLPTVLVVEDNVEMKNYIGNEIGLHYNIITANNGKEALESLKSYSIQLIVSDIMMPVMDGFALLKTVKTTPEYGNIPMILLTAKYSVQSRIEGLEYGADAYIEKPFSLDVLLAQISNLLTNRENVRNAYSQSPIAHLKGMAYTKADEHFMERLNEIIHKHIPDVHLNVDKIADMMNMSRPTLYRKIKAISDLTPNDFIRIARLKRAATLIQEKQLKIYEISEAVGFSSQSYFSRSFIKQFGMNPSEFARRLNEE